MVRLLVAIRADRKARFCVCLLCDNCDILCQVRNILLRHLLVFRMNEILMEGNVKLREWGRGLAEELGLLRLFEVAHLPP